MPMRALAYLWAAPCSLIGLLFVPLALLAGGGLRRVEGVLEVAFAGLPRGRFAAITFGHVIVGRDAQSLEQLRAHEHAHVRQYERWGPLFLVAYPLAGLFMLLTGRRPYWHNPFEVQARRIAGEDIDAPGSRRTGTVKLSTESLNLLELSWERSWRRLGARGDGEAVFRRLLTSWEEPHRHYHTLQHLAECLTLLQEHGDVAEHPAEVEMAIWFHDAVYDVRGKDSEARSAAWAADALTAGGVGADAITRIRTLIMATCHDALPLGVDAQLLVDIDLAVLGASPERFAEYEQQVRAEYAWVPAWVFRRRRREILAEFAERQPLYRTPALRALLEDRARTNLAGALAALG